MYKAFSAWFVFLVCVSATASASDLGVTNNLRKHVGLGYDVTKPVGIVSDAYRVFALDEGSVALENYPEVRNDSRFGESFDSFNSEMAGSINASFRYGLSKAHMKVNFSIEEKTTTKLSYYMFKGYYSTYRVSVSQLRTADLAQQFTDRARSEILGSSMSADDVIRNYGTHVIRGYNLGGTLTMTSKTNSSQSSALNSIAAAAGAKQKGLGSLEVAGSLSQGSESGSMNSNSLIYTTGGDPGIVDSRLDPRLYAAWQASIKESPTITYYQKTDLTPIYEFATGARRDQLETAFHRYLKAQMFRLDLIKGNSTVKLKSRGLTGKYVCHAQNEQYDGASYFYPVLCGDENKAAVFTLSGPNAALSSETTLQLKVIGRASQDKESLGAWDHQQALYFWHADQLESHDRDKVKWTIEPAQANALIKSLSPVRVKNVHFTDKPYLAPYRHSSGTTYVTTTDDGITDSTVFEIILVK